ncbi:MAG: four helix bundle protein [Fimbriimonadaceae bacterium]
MEDETRRGFRELKVWQAAMNLVVAVHAASDCLPRCEDYALKSQLRRSAYSVPCNIAEGSARTTDKDFLSFLAISAGSLRELETQTEIALRVGYITSETHERLQIQIDAVARMLTGLMTAIRRRSKPPN